MRALMKDFPRGLRVEGMFQRRRAVVSLAVLWLEGWGSMVFCS